MLSDSQASDNIGGVSGFGSPRDFLHRPITGRGVIIGDQNDYPGHEQTDERREIEVVWRTQKARDHHAVWKKPMGGGPEQDG